MKILITVGIYPPDIGGPASFVPKIANLLSQNSNEVTVICLSNNKIKIIKAFVPDKVKLYIDTNLSKELSHFQKKYS